MLFRKKRVFVDMDGTLTVFQVVSDETLNGPGYFANLAPHENVVKAVKRLCKNPRLEVFVLSAVLPNPYAKPEKRQWLDCHLPEIDDRHRIFCPNGQEKGRFVPGGVRKSDVLLEDYTHNLNQWKGRGLKLRNEINGSKGTWKGPSVDYRTQPNELYRQLTAFAEGK